MSFTINLTAWRTSCLLGYASNLTAADAVTAVCPDGWTVHSSEYTSTQKKAIRMDGPTPLEVVQEVCTLHGCAVRFSTSAQFARLVDPEGSELSSMIIADGLNLQKMEYRGQSSGVYTRLYPIGKDGLTIASVNDGLEYVQDLSQVKRVVSKLWVDERYTDADSLKTAALQKLGELSRVSRSWEVDVADLYRLAGREDLLLELFALIRFLDPVKHTTRDVRIVQRREYPYYPNLDKIWLSEGTGTARQGTQQLARQLARQLDNPNSDFWQRLNAR